MAKNNLNSGRALARYANLSHDAVGRALLGGRPEPKTLEKMAVKLKVDYNYLMGLAGYTRPSTELAISSVGNATDITEGKIILVPYLEGTAASAGVATMEGTIPYLLEPGQSGHRFRALAVTGTCMEDEIRQGDLVIFDLDSKPKSGDIVVAALDDQILVKRLKLVNGTAWLVPNSDQPSVRVTAQVQILGVVCWSARRH
jgi:SOS-response transcriptional repressor LexA